MRRLLVVFGLFASISAASAADYELPTLRGAEPVVSGASPCCPRWGGFYVGGQVGYTSAGADFGSSVNDLAAAVVRNTILEPVVADLATLPKADSNGTSFGGFFGYNSQW